MGRGKSSHLLSATHITNLLHCLGQTKEGKTGDEAACHGEISVQIVGVFAKSKLVSFVGRRSNLELSALWFCGWRVCLDNSF